MPPFFIIPTGSLKRAVLAEAVCNTAAADRPVYRRLQRTTGAGSSGRNGGDLICSAVNVR